MSKGKYANKLLPQVETIVFITLEMNASNESLGISLGYSPVLAGAYFSHLTRLLRPIAQPQILDGF